jgi:hypothetical protein
MAEHKGEAGKRYALPPVSNFEMEPMLEAQLGPSLGLALLVRNLALVT